MTTTGWKKERSGDGRYHVRGIGGYRLAGLVIGGNGRWFVELGGRQWPDVYPSAAAACAALAKHHGDGRAS
jgi:hypothetical protein